MGHTVYELVPELEPHWRETYARVALGGERLRFENGSETVGRWFEVHATPVEPRGRLVLVFRDVMSRHRSENEFLVTLSRELRNALAPISNAARILRADHSRRARSSDAARTDPRRRRRSTDGPTGPRPSLEYAAPSCARYARGIMDSLRHYDRDATAAALDRGELIDALARAFAGAGFAPTRTRHAYGARGADDGSLLVMPSWDPVALGVKLVTVTPANGARGLPAVNAIYLLFDATTGAPRALVDGDELTLRRTGAVSALAARHLAHAEATRLLVVGTGRLAPHLALSHARVRPLREIRVWGRRPEAAQATARDLRLACQREGSAPTVDVCADLEDGVRWADVVTCATLSREPLVRGAWLRSGQHLDLVGAFRPDMREADDECLRRAALWVDTRSGALAEAGELVQGIAVGAIAATDVRGELSDLIRRDAPIGRDASSITLFKSVGTAIADLAAARLVAG